MEQLPAEFGLRMTSRFEKVSINICKVMWITEVDLMHQTLFAYS
jgi:hypothetical protein